MSPTLYQQIQQFYDASSSLWEQVWGEHMHHGYYGADGTQKKDRRQAQIDLIEEVLKWTGVQQAENILDVGCGIGGSSLYLAGKFNARTTGITLSPVQAARATERASEFGLSARSHFQVADAQAMPFTDNSFDLVWSLESGEHMPDKRKFLQECYRVLKPGGTLIMVTWCHRAIDNLPLRGSAVAHGGNHGRCYNGGNPRNALPPQDRAASPLTADEEKHLAEIYRVYCLPYVISLPEYEVIARELGLQNIRTADWSKAVAPFWNVVIDSAFSPMAIWGLLCSGWGTIQAALSLGLMSRGYERGLIRFGLLCGKK